VSKTLAYKKVLGDKIYDLYRNAKKLNSATDFQVAWNEIAAGLDAVK
jgi:hypothetical protein